MPVPRGIVAQAFLPVLIVDDYFTAANRDPSEGIQRLLSVKN
jgi:hypothetical protein